MRTRSLAHVADCDGKSPTVCDGCAQDHAITEERERLAKMFWDEANATPEGAEDKSKGSSIYNWLTYAARKIRGQK